MSLKVSRRHVVGGLAGAAGLAALGARPARALEPVKVAIISRTFFYLPLWAATHRGFMRDEGLDVDIKILDRSKEVNELLRKGEVQFTLRTSEAAMIDSYKGGTMRVIAGGISKLPHFIIAKPEIKTLEQLRGANFGILAEKEGTTYIVQDIMKQLGFTPDDYKMTVVGGSPARQRLLKEGKIDAGLQPIPASYEAEAAGFTNLGSVIRFVPDWQFTSVNVEEPWAKQHHDTVVSFLRGLQRGRDFIETNPAESAQIAAEELHTTVPYAARMLEDVKKYGMLEPQTAINVPGIKRVFETLQKAGSIAADKTFDMKVFADLSYWEESHQGLYTSSIPTPAERK
ncbi:MAG TPA: ABC transporter substrate-binding protein [Xanthobacteraceae bacterium]|jgi:ABC-type nitrate/sulfonate/bicarbonate transport system substrate-binding protein|nr:ABC transporter substrate-binding protein [Xanthobacteraceae bacterium]